MSKEKWTKGPWVVDQGAKVYCEDSTGSIVAQCDDFSFVFRDDGEQEANAHLISAAPDMYEALKVFADCVEQIDEEESDEEWAKFRLLVKDFRKASKALAKARGEIWVKPSNSLHFN